MSQPSNPGWAYNYVPSAGEWNNTFGGKVDYPAPVGQGGTGSLTPSGANYNLQQRAEITTSTAAALALTSYACRTDLSAITISLPLIIDLLPGDWIEFTDTGYNASVNNVTVNCAGSDELKLWGVTGTSAVLSINGTNSRFVATSAGYWSVSTW